MQVIFLKRDRAYFPGANPNLPDEDATKLIEKGICVKHSDEVAKQVKEAILAAEAKGETLQEVELTKKHAKPS